MDNVIVILHRNHCSDISYSLSSSTTNSTNHTCDTILPRALLHFQSLPSFARKFDAELGLQQFSTMYIIQSLFSPSYFFFLPCATRATTLTFENINAQTYSALSQTTSYCTNFKAILFLVFSSCGFVLMTSRTFHTILTRALQ